MYTGRTERPCCLCGDRETATRLDVPPRAVTLMDNADPIAWRDIVGEVSVHFCEADWETVAELVLEVGVNPLPRCNAARASFSIREDYEALLNERREAPDQTALERRLLERSRRTLRAAEDPMTEARDLVEARVVEWSLAELGVAGAAGEEGL